MEFLKKAWAAPAKLIKTVWSLIFSPVGLIIGLLYWWEHDFAFPEMPEVNIPSVQPALDLLAEYKLWIIYSVGAVACLWLFLKIVRWWLARPRTKIVEKVVYRDVRVEPSQQVRKDPIQGIVNRYEQTVERARDLPVELDEAEEIRELARMRLLKDFAREEGLPLDE